MASYQLNIVHQGTVHKVALQSGETVRAPASAHTQYKLFNQNGTLLMQPETKMVGNDLWVLLDENSNKPLLILENYTSSEYVTDAMTLLQDGNTFAILGSDTMFSAPVQTVPVISKTAVAASGGKMAAIAAGVALLGGTAAIAGKNNGKNETAPTQPETPPAQPTTSTTQPKPVTPAKPAAPTAQITINKIAGDDIINQAEAKGDITLSGSLKYTGDVSANDVKVNVNVAGKTIAATVNGNTWTAKVAGSLLAGKQGANNVTATINVSDSAKQTASATANHAYTVDTQIDKPLITIDKITGDDFVSLTEAKQTTINITGTVRNANNGDKVTLKVGNASYTGEVQNGKFAVAVDGKTLAVHQSVSVSVNTKDAAGNTAAGNGSRNYQVEVAQPTQPTQPVTPAKPTAPTVQITINKIAGDDIINQAEAKGDITLSGSLKYTGDVSANDVKVNVNVAGKTIAATVNGNTWTAKVAGSLLAGKQGANNVTATINVSDSAKQTASATANHAYTVDTQIDKPVITIDKITGDDFVSLTEAKQTTINITGTVRNANNGDKVTLKVGNASYTGEVQNGKFAVAVDGKTLAVHQSVSVSVNTKDAAGNTAAGNGSRNYQVEAAPVKTNVSVEIDNVTSDNVVNKVESQGDIAVTGTVRNGVAGQEVVVSCGCPACSNPGWVSIATTLKNDGTFVVNFEGNDVAKGTTIKVTLPETGTTNAANNSKDYSVDVTAPTITPTLGKITGDNVINKAESTGNVTLSGSLKGIAAGDKVTVTINVAGKNHTATVNGNNYSLTLKASELANGNKVVVTAKSIDAAGNEATGKAEQTYVYDAIINKPSITIDAINGGKTINSTIKGNITLSGSLKHDADVSNPEVKITINGKEHTAQVNGTKWTLSVPVTTLTSKQGEQNISATINVKDAAGNTESASNTAKYTVDTQISATVKLNAITSDNQLDSSEISKDIDVSGKVTGEFQNGDKVKITVGNKTYDTTVNAQGVFTVKVAGTQLATASKVTATVVATDAAGNSITVSDDQAYTLKTSSTTTTSSITLDNIANDGYINAVEAKGNIKVSGSIEGSNAAAGQKVSLVIAGKTHTVNVDSSLKFSLNVNASDLTTSKNRQISASWDGASTSKTYNVGDYASAKINITNVGTNNGNIGDAEGTVRLSGQLTNLTGIWGKGKNATKIYNVTVKIGEESYVAGINEENQTFHINIPTNKLSSLKGKTLSYSFETADTLIDYKDATGVRVTNKYGMWENVLQQYIADDVKVADAPALGSNNIVFDDNAILSKNSNGGYTVKDVSNTTTISGTVSGTAKANDVVKVVIDGTTYTGKVVSGNKFTVDVPTSVLSKQTDIVATLETRDTVGNSISVSDSTHYAASSSLSDGTFAQGNVHSKMNYSDLPYFIAALAGEGYNETVNIRPSGHLTHTGYGANSKVIKYYFATMADYVAMRNSDSYLTDRTVRQIVDSNPMEYDQTKKDLITEALQSIAKYTDITFELVNNYRDADIHYYMINTQRAVGQSDVLGYAYFGGEVVLDSQTFGQDYDSLSQWAKDQFYLTTVHETMHSLGVKHSFYENSKPTARNLDDIEDMESLTLMSYDSTDIMGKYDLRIYDLAYLHYRYGVNPNARTGNDTYTFQNFNAKESDGGIYIWDGGGIDTFDASAEKQAVNVNLTPGSWIYRGTQSRKFAIDGMLSTSIEEYTGQYSIHPFNSGKKAEVYNFTEGQAFIGFGTQIENLKGSAYNDILTGNAADNVIYGNAGDDTIYGGDGNDYLDGGTGKDKLFGGKGNDTYVIDDIGDTITEYADEGIDTVYSSLNSYTLGANLENLTLIGNAMTAIGNNLANTLTANNHGNTLDGGAGNDTLIGGTGADTLTGGAGNDTFVFSSVLNGSIDTITDFTKGDKIALSKSVFSALGNTLDAWSTYIKYEQSTGALSYDADGAGGLDAQQFATLTNKAALDQNSFILI
ncbi:Ig-like domain-containing protein [Wielerella bovis]|uniref:Ig-like domain-containing protein n=1 Tax=Wielerella bovis TaxID=2917790 RepID=UPI002018E49E|nr:Ig-like domain-containing protein [Wielerella bovis]ULJ59657.1 Ig-like domain-containing protein [Wielerella bovis]